MAEHSGRAYFVTEQVKLWITNDGEHVEMARRIARTCSEMQGVAIDDGPRWLPLHAHLLRIVTRSRPGTAAWHVGQEMAPNDWSRIWWVDVADELEES